MVDVSKIAWGKYSTFRGPMYLGSKAFVLPSAPVLADQILATIAATEGGHWDAVNMYDRCVCSVGLIQWCEAGQYSVSDMLGAVAERDPSLLDPLKHMMALANVTFRQNARGRWRFFFGDARGEVDRISEQQQLFLLHSTGLERTWDAASKDYAKGWAAALASVFEAPAAILAQRDYTAPRVRSFATAFAAKWIAQAPSSGIGQAFVCSYLSFAANNPTWADQALQSAVGRSKAPAWTMDWFIDVLYDLVFHAGITIYPARYAAIRPLLERMFAIDLPDFADQLSASSAMSSTEVQQYLVDLGYDLGSSGQLGNGVDGKWGNKSITALAEFERRHGLVADGWPDVSTNEVLRHAHDLACG